MNRSEFIRASSLHKRYRDGEGNILHILRGLDLTVDEGESVSIMGASRAGKSTLLHLLGALDRADCGPSHLAGVSLGTRHAEGPATFRNRAVG